MRNNRAPVSLTRWHLVLPDCNNNVDVIVANCVPEYAIASESPPPGAARIRPEAP
jgi:hypothetical protein